MVEASSSIPLISKTRNKLDLQSKRDFQKSSQVGKKSKQIQHYDVFTKHIFKNRKVERGQTFRFLSNTIKKTVGQPDCYQRKIDLKTNGIISDLLVSSLLNDEDLVHYKDLTF